MSKGINRIGLFLTSLGLGNMISSSTNNQFIFSFICISFGIGIISFDAWME